MNFKYCFCYVVWVLDLGYVPPARATVASKLVPAKAPRFINETTARCSSRFAPYTARCTSLEHRGIRMHVIIILISIMATMDSALQARPRHRSRHDWRTPASLRSLTSLRHDQWLCVIMVNFNAETTTQTTKTNTQTQKTKNQPYASRINQPSLLIVFLKVQLFFRDLDSRINRFEGTDSIREPCFLARTYKRILPNVIHHFIIKTHWHINTGDIIE